MKAQLTALAPLDLQVGQSSLFYAGPALLHSSVISPSL